MKTTSTFALKYLGMPVLCFVGLLFAEISFAQSYEKLTQLKGYDNLDVYFSSGYEARAKAMADRCHKAMSYASKVLGVQPTVTLMLLSAADWPGYTKHPLYGMPHFFNSKILVMAVEDSELTRAANRFAEQLPNALASEIRKVYGREDGSLSFVPFFDALTLHELGHAIQRQGGMTIQRRWMDELFANIFLHTYVAENEPERLPELTTLQRIRLTTQTTVPRYTSLKDFEDHYEELGQDVNAYGYYQMRLHDAAGYVYDTYGTEGLTKSWAALQAQKERLNDADLAVFLEKNVKPIADVLTGWGKHQ